MTPLVALLNLATTPEQVDSALAEVGRYDTYAKKVAFLEGLTQAKILHRSGGGDEDDFWALAEAIVNRDIELNS